LNYNASNNSKLGKKNNGSILVLDDDFDITTLIKIALRRHGYNVFGFTNPFLALEHFKINHSTYSLVISDLRMPSMSGFQFIQNIKLIRPKINVLLMSAFDVIGDSEFSTQSSEYKIDGFLQKPISIKKLNSIINSYMMKK
jgi:two-component system nitrogen regulation response regulator GlnG